MESKIQFNPDLESEGGKLYRQYCEDKCIEYSITAGANFCLGYMAVKPNDPITAAADRISDKLIAIVKKQLGEPVVSAGESDAVDPQELWDEFSQYIEDDVSSLQIVAGSSVMTEADFKKAFAKFKQKMDNP